MALACSYMPSARFLNGRETGRAPVKLEGVWSISVRGLPLQVLWQVDDHDSIKRAFLHSEVYTQYLHKDLMRQKRAPLALDDSCQLASADS